MFRHILENFLFEKMCLEFQNALKEVLKIVWEALKNSNAFASRMRMTSIIEAYRDILHLL